MDKDYHLADDGSCTIKNYNSTHPFSNFLPGIAGVWGVPVWVFYANRAQGVVSFGIGDKNHSIAEFFPANKAYSFVPFLGFRTFLKIDGKTYYEPFRVVSQNQRDEAMIIKSSSFEIQKTNHSLGLNFSVKYFTLPNSPLGALVRVLSIKNISAKAVNLEVLDGLSRIIPFGCANVFLKDISRTLEAWMRANVSGNLALFRLIVDPKDTSQTEYIKGANFNYSFYEEREKKIAPYLIVDPQAIFAHDTSYLYPVKFFNSQFKTPINQITCGKTPCSFSSFAWSLKPDEEKIFYSIFGASAKPELINEFTPLLNSNFLGEKEAENEKIIEQIKNSAFCASGSKRFNHYIKATYLDNILRGGYPHKFDGDLTYYIFSRKHGDLERDYNNFKLLPSCFSEGEGNYRDINQNRRLDLFFNPFIKRKNIIYFLNFIKIDGYNPLIVKGEKLFFNQAAASIILKEFKIESREILSLMKEGFYLGEFFTGLSEAGIKVEKREELVKALLKGATKEPAASFDTGFWIDHWHYNLDLIENFLYFYPDAVGDLFLSKDYCFWDDEYRVRRRKARLRLKGDDVYQGQAIEEDSQKKSAIHKRKRFKNFLRTKKGRIVKISLTVKLLTLILNKSAGLDPEGIGVEMEAGKPGWCDSLNGLPALLGSSLCETLEIKRACLLLLRGLKQLSEGGTKRITLPKEVFSFFNRLNRLIKDYFSSKTGKRDYLWWDKANFIKENFRQETFSCLLGEERQVKIESLERFTQRLVVKLNLGIDKAKDKKSGLYFTYFTYAVTKYRSSNKAVIPLEFVRRNLPLFLQGPMHALKVEADKSIYPKVKKSELFDKALKMYRLNASLENESLEIGRSRIFVPGWLENESIWLHMEYKYLLEVLKNGLYREFFSDFYNCCVCFFDPQKYGRNILENSSFIVSSAYPDKSLWGKGFIARLSGATVELLNIWMLLCLGRRPFFVDDAGLHIQFSPILEARMFTTKEETIDLQGEEITIEKNCFAFKLFSSILVVYHNPRRTDTFKNCKVKTIIVQAGGEKHIINSSIIAPPLSYRIREAKADRIDLYLE
ncbi:MAG: hypothetical protein KKC11_05510 [Candidatus Omnitrophica bacterium]|nr:hypothetical protein [Candidatus Omnitrophota bacterium]